MKTVRVRAPIPYDVMIGYGMLSSLGDALLQRHGACRVALVSDETVYTLYGGHATAALSEAGFSVVPCRIPPGEEGKTMDTVSMLLERFARNGLARGDIIVALGGGVTADVAGFAASLYLGGIPYAQVATTLLAAVDPVVGGELWLHLPEERNMVRTLWQPMLVLCDCDTLASIPTEVYEDGVAESLKYGVIMDQGLFEKVARGALEEECEDVIARCVEIKAMLSSLEGRDRERAQLLNFGRAIARSTQALSGYTLPYGHALAMGMAAMTRLSEALELCVMGCAGILLAMLDRLDLPSEIPYEPDAMARIIMAEKRRLGGAASLVVPESIGHCMIYPIEITDLPRLFRMAKGERW